MARISSYQNDTQVTGTDKVIGTDGSGQATKNFQVQDIGAYFNKSGNVAIARQIPFVFYSSWPIAQRPAGSITFATQTVSPFSSTTELIISKTTSGGKTIADFVSYAIGNVIYIFSADDPNVFGEFKLVSMNTWTTDANFYRAVVQFIAGYGSLTHEETVGFAVESKQGGDKNFTFIQSTSAAVWTITHNLGKRPSISVVDSAGTNVVGAVDHTSNNELTITFSSAFKGTAYLN
jgi:hypothetical protein